MAADVALGPVATRKECDLAAAATASAAGIAASAVPGTIGKTVLTATLSGALALLEAIVSSLRPCF